VTRLGDLVLSASVLAIVLKMINAVMLMTRLLGARYFDVRGRPARPP